MDEIIGDNELFTESYDETTISSIRYIIFVISFVELCIILRLVQYV